MPAVVPPARCPSCHAPSRGPSSVGRPSTAGLGGGAAEPTLAAVAAQYLERHIRRHLVPRAGQLAAYAHTFLATVAVPGPDGRPISLMDKPFRQITTADIEEAIERKAAPTTRVMRRGTVQWTRRVGADPPPIGSTRICGACGAGPLCRAMATRRRSRGPGCRRCGRARNTRARGAWWAMKARGCWRRAAHTSRRS